MLVGELHKRTDALKDLADIGAYFTLPDADGAPSEVSREVNCSNVAFLVRLDLSAPKV